MCSAKKERKKAGAGLTSLRPPPNRLVRVVSYRSAPHRGVVNIVPYRVVQVAQVRRLGTPGPVVARGPGWVGLPGRTRKKQESDGGRGADTTAEPLSSLQTMRWMGAKKGKGGVSLCRRMGIKMMPSPADPARPRMGEYRG